MASANYLEERMTILQIGIKEKHVSLKESNGASFHNFRGNTAFFFFFFFNVIDF